MTTRKPPRELVEMRQLVRERKQQLRQLRLFGLRPEPHVEANIAKAGRMLAQLEREWLEAQHGEGCVKAAKCRETGTTVQLYRPGTQDSDPALLASGEESDGPGWLAVCREHGSCVTVESRKSGEYLVSHPKEFCDDCREL